jgi:prevent-host-death family protein
MKTWPVQDAKARFSEMLDTCLSDGPQLVTRRGTAQAVLVPVAAWQSLQAARSPQSLKDWLLTDFARGDIDLPPRTEILFREPPDLNDA